MEIERLARRQLDDYDRHQPGGLFAGYAIPMTVEDAYTLQLAVVRLREERGEPVAGYKVGCISPALQAQLHLDRPVFGHVFETEVYKSGVVLNAGDFACLSIEGELAVRLATDIPDEDWLRSHQDEAVASAFAVIELHNYVFRNTPHQAQELIGNNAMQAGVILPALEPPFRGVAGLVDTVIEVCINGVIRGRSDGTALPEGPFGSVLRVARHLAGSGQFLRRGQIVLTGATLPLYPVADGDRVKVSCDRSGSVACVIAGTGEA